MENLHIFLEFASMQILTRSTLLTALTRVSFWLIAKKLTASIGQKYMWKSLDKVMIILSLIGASQ